MQELFDLLKNNISQDDYNYIYNIYDNIKEKYVGNSLNSSFFASSIAKEIFENRLDANSIIIGLMYPIYKLNHDIINESFSNDEIRKQTMPIANKYSIGQIIDAAKYYFNKTNIAGKINTYPNT